MTKTPVRVKDENLDIPSMTYDGGLSVETVSIDSIQPHPENVRVHNDANITAIMNSLAAFKQRRALVVWNGLVIAGNGTLEAARQLGWKNITITRADDLSENDAKAYAIADNKTTDMSEFDYSKLAITMQQLHTQGVDLTRTGFQKMEVAPLLEGWNPEHGIDPSNTNSKDANNTHKLGFTDDQWVLLIPAFEYARANLSTQYEVTTDAEALVAAVYDLLKKRTS